MNARNLANGLLVIGVLVVLLAFAWPFILPSDSLWDDTQARDLNQASEALHETMHAHGHGHKHDDFGDVQADANPEVAAAANRYREAQSKLKSAKFWTARLPAYLRWSGLGFCAIGVVAFFVSRKS